MNRNGKLSLSSCIPVWVYGLMLFHFQVSENKDLKWNKGYEKQAKLGQKKPKIFNNLISDSKVGRHCCMLHGAGERPLFQAGLKQSRRALGRWFVFVPVSMPCRFGLWVTRAYSRRNAKRSNRDCFSGNTHQDARKKRSLPFWQGLKMSLGCYSWCKCKACAILGKLQQCFSLRSLKREAN